MGLYRGRQDGAEHRNTAMPQMDALIAAGNVGWMYVSAR
jgi:hypothetical protein